MQSRLPLKPPQSLWFRLLGLLVQLVPLRDKFYTASILLRKTLSDHLAGAPTDEYTFTWAGPADIQFILTHRGQFSRSEVVYARRSARGHFCFCAKMGENIAGYRWVAFDTCSFLAGGRQEVEFFPLTDGQAYLYELYTYEEYRHRGIGANLTMRMLQALKERGVKEVYNAVDPSNVGSMNIHLRLGFRPQRFLYYYRIRKWKTGFLGPPSSLAALSEWARDG